MSVEAETCPETFQICRVRPRYVAISPKYYRIFVTRLGQTQYNFSPDHGNGVNFSETCINHIQVPNLFWGEKDKRALEEEVSRKNILQSKNCRQNVKLEKIVSK